ncbi:hypothetical protein DYBT9275_03194 [Dyadobacter sp. CECT 9275]|uniref:Alkaline phosphatase n=1 Tax=Dyadobacter helix TaxID=2822344 RepID=A0A916JFN6_9BACT|nr:phosphatidylinositol-specific phospholipase C/glycerophosphodiester phosphodiesterase family protein [Dyadobacter sp. CECT 9275]CAG5003625.1 hypothetical protein DYBT9275_03194 [Dyadobacter sp. CECT 9275]
MILTIRPVLFLLFLAISGTETFAQSSLYTPAQAHSHNDYEHKNAFWDAYKQGFGSIEADLILQDSVLYTAHDKTGISEERTFKKLYLEPIISEIEKNGGKIYAQSNTILQLLIDLKTPATETMAVLLRELAPYEQYLAPKGTVKIVISGNTPDPTTYNKYPDYIYFDGRPDISYTKYQLLRLGLISQSFQTYSKWNGEGEMLKKDQKRLEKVISQAHELDKKIRFWATPDNINAWKTMMSLKVDYLNTDKVVEMGDYLRTAPK